MNIDCKMYSFEKGYIEHRDPYTSAIAVWEIRPLHPLVSAIDLSKANVMQRTIKFDFYTILLLECECEDFIYGRKYYDYSNATMIFLTPGQFINVNEGKAFPPKGGCWLFIPTCFAALHWGGTLRITLSFLIT